MILVVTEQQQGRLNRASWEPIAAAQETGDRVVVAVLGEGVGEIARDLASAAVAEVLTVEHPRLAAYTADGYVHALVGVIAAEQPSLVFAPHTYQTRDYLPMLAARLDRALATDCVAIRPRPGGLAYARPMFQAKLYADVVLQGPEPHFVSFQVGAYRADAVLRGESAAPVRAVPVDLDAAVIRQQPEPPFREARQAVDLTQADRIVSVGRGIKAAEHLDLARRLAEALGAELAASRPICDAGWLPMDRQVGSSGQTVSPKLYLALGISGAIQHVVGMKGAKTIVAVNKDPDAPIFEIADYGIVGDLFEIVPAMIEALQAGSS
jgi:electron transfer flavoprotein alpha subunit